MMLTGEPASWNPGSAPGAWVHKGGPAASVIVMICAQVRWFQRKLAPADPVDPGHTLGVPDLAHLDCALPLVAAAVELAGKARAIGLAVKLVDALHDLVDPRVSSGEVGARALDLKRRTPWNFGA